LTQVDVIVSDFMGDCVLSQGDQMEQVIEARDRFLKPNGKKLYFICTSNKYFKLYYYSNILIFLQA